MCALLPRPKVNYSLSLSDFPSGTTPMMHPAFLATTHALVRPLINHPVYGRGHSFLPVSSVRPVALGVCVGNGRERGRETCGGGLSKNNSSWWRGKATGSWQTGVSPGNMSSCEGPQLGGEIKPECLSSTWSRPFSSRHKILLPRFLLSPRLSWERPGLLSFC